jgi:nucleoside-diphosphate-sugar epimerase
MLRPRSVVGRGRLGLFDVIFSRVRAGKRVPIFGRGDNRVQLCDGDDFCDAALAAIERHATGDYHVGTASYGTVREDIQGLIDHAGTGAKLQPVPAWAIRAVLRPLDLIGRSPFTAWHYRGASASLYCDLSPAMSELGWRPKYSNAEALARAYDDYVARPERAGESVHRSPLPGALARALRG